MRQINAIIAELEIVVEFQLISFPSTAKIIS